MANNDKEFSQQQSAETTQSDSTYRKEQFNELSELSLEERIAVADQIGVPVNNVIDAAALGTATGGDVEGDFNDDTEEQSTGEERDQ